MKQGLLEIDKFKEFSPIGAFIFAMASHAGQYRADNETPYISHSFEVAKQLDDWGLKDDRYLTIALLHDVLEKTKATKDMLIKIFGEEITNEVVKISFDENEMTENEYFELNKDNVIKLADHLCNTRFFIGNKIRDPKKYYEKGIALINNFRNKSPYKKSINDIETKLNNLKSVLY